MSPDVAASIKARLLAKAKQRREEFELFLVRYACERFLYRLGASEMRERCVLKGAGLLTLWMPIRDAIVGAEAFDFHWPAGGSWREGEGRQ